MKRDHLLPPEIIEELSFETLLEARKKQLLERNADLKDALNKSSDPLVQSMRVEAYRELLLRQRINEAMRGHLLAFAIGESLDSLGNLYGVTRKLTPKEADNDYRERIHKSIKGAGTAGTKEHYETVARQAHEAVQDVNVVPMAESPGEIVVSLLINDHAEVTDPTQADLFTKQATFVEGFHKDFYPHLSAAQAQALIHPRTFSEFGFDPMWAKRSYVQALVAQRVMADDVKMLTDKLHVRLAKAVPCTIQAEIVFKNNALHKAKDLRLQLLSDLKRHFQDEVRLGWDLTPSWIHKQLYTKDVHHVNLLTPSHVVFISPDKYASLSDDAITLESKQILE
jgi:phage-related baseplate assembly protein